MLDNKKVDKIIVSSVSLILVVVISIIGLSYSYFSTQIVGNDESSSVIITTLAIEASSQGLAVAFEYTGETYESMPIVRAIDNPTEEFYDITNAVNYSSLDSSFKELIDYDASKSILLARYNLNKTTGMQTTSTTTSDYAVPFSGSSDSNGYWYDSTTSTIKTKYGNNYDNSNIYDTYYITAPNYSVAFKNNAGNANYSIAYYVENYVSSLGVNAEGRLLTYPEANSMMKNQRRNGQSYWLGSASNYGSVRCVDGDGVTGSGSFGSASSSGVRPVVVVSTSDIQ